MVRRLYEEEYDDKPVRKKKLKRRSAEAQCEDTNEELLIRSYRAGRDVADLALDIFKLFNGR